MTSKTPTRKRATKKTASKKAPVKKAVVVDLREKPKRSKRYAKAMCELAEKVAKLGATDKEIADVLDITVRQLYRFRNQHPEFAEALKVGKDVADERVERALFHRAIGFTVKREKLFNNGDHVIRAEYEEEVLPDVTASLAWLNNRQPDRWRQNRHLRGGNEPGEGDKNINIDARVVIEQRLTQMSKVIHGDNPPVIEGNAEEVKKALMGLITGVAESQEKPEVTHDSASAQS